jgi:hypothetical protein
LCTLDRGANHDMELEGKGPLAQLFL